MKKLKFQAVPKAKFLARQAHQAHQFSAVDMDAAIVWADENLPKCDWLILRVSDNDNIDREAFLDNERFKRRAGK